MKKLEDLVDEMQEDDWFDLEEFIKKKESEELESSKKNLIEEGKEEIEEENKEGIEEESKEYDDEEDEINRVLNEWINENEDSWDLTDIKSSIKLEDWKKIFTKWVSRNESLFPNWEVQYSWKKDLLITWELVAVTERKNPSRTIYSRELDNFKWFMRLEEWEEYFTKIKEFTNLKTVSYIRSNNIITWDCEKCSATWKEKCIDCWWKWEVNCSQCWWRWQINKRFTKKEQADWWICQNCWGSKQIWCQWCWWNWFSMWICMTCWWSWMLWNWQCHSCQWTWTVSTKCWMCNWTWNVTCNLCNSSWRVDTIIEVPYDVVEKCWSCWWSWKELCVTCTWDWFNDCSCCWWDRTILKTTLFSYDLVNNIQNVNLSNINKDDSEYIISKFNWTKIETDITNDFLKNNFKSEQVQIFNQQLEYLKQSEARKKVKNLYLIEFIKWQYTYNWVTREIFIIWEEIFLSSEPLTKWWKFLYKILKNFFIFTDVLSILFNRMKKKRKRR